jgi:hypothetical protein
MKSILIEIPNVELSDEGKVKLEKLKVKKEEHLKKMKDDYDSGVFDEFFKDL